MNDILPLKRPSQPTQPAAAPDVEQKQSTLTEPLLPVLLLDEQAPHMPSKKHSFFKKLVMFLVAVAIMLGSAAGAGFLWYQQALSPMSSDKNAVKISVTIESGSTPSQIAELLSQKQIIRDVTAFKIYTRLTNTQNRLQAGLYRLTPAESTEDIVEHLVAGKVDEFTLTFYPGATLTDTTAKDKDKKVDVTTILQRAGYPTEDISAALNKTYDHPLFVDKPATADLEGYIYGETYNFSSSATVEDILTRTFDEFYAKIKQNNLIDGFKKHNLSLYQGITLASIIQREVPTRDDQKQVAQVFYTRMADGMMLGSDVTYQYAADKRGVPRDNNLDDPYNTRINAGLPPGPIGAPGLSSLLAVANPADGDYVYFLSGDDDITYFARTNEEHEQNKKTHCAYKCSLP